MPQYNINSKAVSCAQPVIYLCQSMGTHWQPDEIRSDVVQGLQVVRNNLFDLQPSITYSNENQSVAKRHKMIIETKQIH